MSVSTFLLLYTISVPLFLVIDLLWLGVVARGFYQAQLGHLLGEINWTAAIIFYFIFLAGLVFFAVYPAVLRSSLLVALCYGALFGFFTYATYDLTNLATLKDWPLPLAVVDIVWGTFLGGAVATATYLTYTAFVASP